MKFIKTYHNPSSLYINKKDKWLWLRIHKTAGTSIYDGFLKDYCLNKRHQDKEVTQWINTIDTLNDYFVWAFVRNPYDRFNSVAGMFKIDPNDLASEYIEHTKQSIIKRHSVPQYKFTHYKGKPMYNYLGNFENLQDDFNVICDKINIPKIQLPKLNTSKHNAWQTDFNDKTIEFVNQQYRADFEYFNYKMV